MDDPLSLLWQQISKLLKPHGSEDTFERWFSDIAILSADENQILFQVPNNIYQLWIENNYLEVLRACIFETLRANPEIKFTPQTEKEREEKEKQWELEEEASNSRKTSKKSSKSASASKQSDQAGDLVSGMNPRNTFKNFVVGSNNQFAHAACLAVAQSPGRTYNPLFIYGGVGLGKTHLMHAIGQHILQKSEKAKVIYLSSEKFTNEFITAIQNGTLPKFRKRYRQADMLLIDDIQFLAGKERSQEEFFHTFNTMFDGHKQIVLSSDRPASEISHLESRLVSRFEWGMTTELQPPDIETRTAILRKKAESLQVSISAEIIEYIAARIKSNVRRLEGALIRVASLTSLGNHDLTPETVEHLLRDILQEEAKRIITIDHIQRKVAEHFDIRLADMSSKRRPQNIAFPRQVAMYLSRELTKASLNEIGEAFGGRDHGTVLHAHKLLAKRISSEDHIRQMINLLDAQLQRE